MHQWRLQEFSNGNVAKRRLRHGSFLAGPWAELLGSNPPEPENNTQNADNLTFFHCTLIGRVSA